MSYGRAPYYIIGTRNGPDGYNIMQIMNPMGSVSRGEFPYPTVDGNEMAVNLPDEAVAQLIAHIAARGTEELQWWIDKGAALDDDYTGFHARWAAEASPEDRAEYEEERSWLSVQVQVTRGGRAV